MSGWQARGLPPDIHSSELFKLTSRARWRQTPPGSIAFLAPGGGVHLR